MQNCRIRVARCPPPGRPAIYLAAIAGLAVTPGLPVGATTPQSSEPSRLEVESPFSTRFTANETLVLVFEAQSGTSYLLDIAQGGLDLVISVEVQDGSVRGFDSPLFRDETERVVLDSTADGPVRVTLSTRDYTEKAAQPTIVLRLPQAGDSRELDALRHLSSAAQANHEASQQGWADALSHYREALGIWRQLGNVREEAHAIFCIATIEYWQMLNWAGAIDLAAEAAQGYMDAGEPRLAANALALEAAALIEMANEVEKSASGGIAPEADRLFQQAFELFGQALATQQRLDANYDAAKILNNIGLTHYYRSEWEQAADHFHRAIAIYRPAGEHRAELEPLGNLAVIDFEQGRLTRAIESFQRILQLVPPDRLSGYQAHIMDNLGASQLALGQLDDALQSFSTAAGIHQQFEDLKGEGRSLAGIGITYYGIGERELAFEFLENALEVRSRANDGRGQVSVLNFIGNIRRWEADHAAAIDAHRRALSLATAPVDQARSRLQLAEDLTAAGMPAEALLEVKSAEAAGAALGHAKLQADSQRIRGTALLSDRQTEAALASFRAAEAAYESLGLEAERVQARFGTARASLALGKPEQALALAESVIDAVEGLRTQLVSPELRAFFLASKQDYYTFLIDLLMDAQQPLPADEDERIRRALAVSERRHARALADLVAEDRLAGEAGEGAAARRRELLEQLAESRYRLDRLLERPARTAADNEAQLARVRLELAEAENQLNLLEIDSRENSSSATQPGRQQPLSAPEIQALLDSDTALLHYELGRERSHAWLVTTAGVHAFALPGRAEIEQASRPLYERMQRPAFSAAEQAALEQTLAALSEQVVGPLGSITHKRLIVVADGVLQYLPFAALHGAGPAGEAAPLVRRHEIVYLPSASVLAAQRLKRSASQPPDRLVAIFADPVFSTGDPRARNPASAGRSNATGQSRAGNPGLQRLPATAEEARSIAALVDPAERLLATGFEASVAAVLGADLRQYRFLHFATHGLIDSRYPALSALVFSLIDEQGAPRDGMLRLDDIYTLELNAELVALSACSTALGREIAGEGLTGLTQGLMHAGSRAVLASLWQVPDRATAELMTLFYRKLLIGQQRPAAALREAQLELSSEPRWRSPYFWAAFVLQGDWM